MFTRRKKAGNSSGVPSPGSRLSRLIRSDEVIQGSLSISRNTDREEVYGEDSRIIGNAMREFEYQNARALLAFQQDKRFC